jgi:hypothetical protein
VRVFEPREYFAANRVGERFYYFVEVDRHVVLKSVYSGISRCGELYIYISRYTNMKGC